jgi:hypothetical protein
MNDEEKKKRRRESKPSFLFLKGQLWWGTAGQSKGPMFGQVPQVRFFSEECLVWEYPRNYYFGSIVVAADGNCQVTSNPLER